MPTYVILICHFPEIRVRPKKDWGEEDPFYRYFLSSNWYKNKKIKTTAMDEIDKNILNTMQEEFPVTQRPFAEVGKLVGLDEKEVVERVKRLKNDGYIRRIGPILERKKLKYVSALCGVHVDEGIIMDFVDKINKHSGVTHNYERDGDLNIWFTIAAKTNDEIEFFLSGMEKKYAVKIYRFPEKKVFKIKTFFPL
jgi:siroheme decarboxylase